MFKKGIIIAIITILADQLNKWHLIEIVQVSRNPIEVTPFFNLVMVWNPGISFGMFQYLEHAQIIFSIISLLIVGLILFWLKSTKEPIQAVSLGLIIGGAIGNVIDRIRFGAVADFFDFHIAGYHWPAFNIADIAVFLGAVTLCIVTIFCHEGDKENEN